MGTRFWLLFFMTLVLFSGGGFFLGYAGVLHEIHKVRSIEAVILVEKGFLFPPSFQAELESRLPVHFRIEVADDPDSFLEKASEADLLWARKDWILRTELHLKDFKSHGHIQSLLNQSLSADFFDPEETSSTLLPILWTLPLVRLKPGLTAQTTAELFKMPGEILWPFWGLTEFFPQLPTDLKLVAGEAKSWVLAPATTAPPENSNKGDFWFPPGKIRPFVVCLSFVENEHLSTTLKERLVEEWLNPVILSRLASEAKMALTVVQAEELLPPWQRASALRSFDLTHLARP